MSELSLREILNVAYVLITRNKDEAEKKAYDDSLNAGLGSDPASELDQLRQHMMGE